MSLHFQYKVINLQQLNKKCLFELISCTESYKCKLADSLIRQTKTFLGFVTIVTQRFNDKLFCYNFHFNHYDYTELFEKL